LARNLFSSRQVDRDKKRCFQKAGDVENRLGYHVG
jgi:hypothetical protein